MHEVRPEVSIQVSMSFVPAFVGALDMLHAKAAHAGSSFKCIRLCKPLIMHFLWMWQNVRLLLGCQVNITTPETS